MFNNNIVKHILPILASKSIGYVLSDDDDDGDDDEKSAKFSFSRPYSRETLTNAMLCLTVLQFTTE